jgi:hypothetical protein
VDEFADSRAPAGLGTVNWPTGDDVLADAIRRHDIASEDIGVIDDRAAVDRLMGELSTVRAIIIGTPASTLDGVRGKMRILEQLCSLEDSDGPLPGRVVHRLVDSILHDVEDLAEDEAKAKHSALWAAIKVTAARALATR